MKSLLLIAGALLQTAAPAPPSAPAPQKIDLNSKLINTPDSNWSVYGPDQTSKKLANGGPQNYPAV